MRFPDFSTRGWMAVAMYPMVMAVMYGVVAITVLSFGHEAEVIAPLLVPGIIVMVLASVPVSWLLARQIK